MNLGRFAIDGQPRIGVFGEETVTDVTGSVESFRDALRRVTAGETIPAEGPSSQLSEVSYLPPTTPRNSVFALALNYRAHADEADANIPERPLVFLKLYRSLTGHEAPIANPTHVTSNLDYEAELAAVIGEPATDVSVEEALGYVAGYTILNDTSARDLQPVAIGDDEAIDWFSAKALQGGTPIGPYVVTHDEIENPQDLHIQSRLNGDVMQDDSTGLMVRGVAELVSFVSSRVTLEPGDVIATGTPEGVGAFQNISLASGDTVEITIDGIGRLSNEVA